MLGRLRSWFGRLAARKQSAELREVHYAPDHPNSLIIEIHKRALLQEEEGWQIEPHDFGAWVSDEARRTPGFSVEAAFNSVLDTLGDADHPARSVGQADRWPDAATVRFGDVRSWRDAGRIIVKVVKRETCPAPPPQDDPTHVLFYLNLEDAQQAPLRISREDFTRYLPPRILNHPQFDAGVCFDRAIGKLNGPVDLCKNAGPLTIGSDCGVTIYTDGHDILAVPGQPRWVRKQWQRALRELHRHPQPMPSPGGCERPADF
jgi:hypothetical protein